MSYSMNSNFYPAREPKNGFIGNADVTIANAIRIRGIAVFEKDGERHISFPGFGEGDNRKSYIVPASKEAYAEFLSVVEKAVADDEKHFGWVTGDHFEWDEKAKKFKQLDISGEAVSEPYADARFQIEIKDLCTLYGITTQEKEYTKDGKTGKFIAVDPPSTTPYEKDGEKVYPLAFEGWTNKYEKDGEKKQFDFGRYLEGQIVAQRKELLNRRPSLDEQVNNAEQRAAQAEGKEGPAPEKAR